MKMIIYDPEHHKAATIERIFKITLFKTTMHFLIWILNDDNRKVLHEMFLRPGYTWSYEDTDSVKGDVYLYD